MKKIAFIQNDHESLAVEYFSSILKARGHDVRMFYDNCLFDNMEVQNKFLFNTFNVKKYLLEDLVKFNPDFIGFSVLTDDYKWALGMALEIKKRIDRPIIFGGLHPTICPEEVIAQKCVDVICIGEGEEAIVEYVENPEDHSIKNLWFKDSRNHCRPINNDLDKIPFPDKRLFYDKQPSFTGSYGILTGRGCPYQCTYCASDVLNRIAGKGYLRRRSPENVIAEIQHAQRTVGYKIKVIAFWDDSFTYDVNWLNDFLKLYTEKIRIPFHCTGYPTQITLEKTRMLKAAGCFRLGMGVQSTSEKTRKDILNRPGTNKEIEAAAAACKAAGLTFWFDHILNIPTETEGDQYEALKFYNKVRPSIINVFWLVYYPKTKIIDIAKKHGILTDKMVENINKGDISTAMVGQIGGEYSFGRQDFKGYAFLLHLMPLLSQKQMQYLIDRKMFLNFNAPFLLNFFVKFFVRVKIKQVWESAWFFIVTIRRIIENSTIKLRGGF